MKPIFKFLLFFLLSLNLLSCSSARRSIKNNNKSKEAQIKVLLKWHNDLVKIPALPTYVFETEIHNKKNIEHPDFDYILINPSWCFDGDACAFQGDQKLVSIAKSYMIKVYGTKYDSLFLQPEMQKAYDYLDAKKLKYENVWLQIPVQKSSSVNADSILQASYLLSPKLPSYLPDDQFEKIFKTSYENYDKTNRLNSYYNFKREWVKRELFKRYYAQPFENISELVESDRYNPEFKVNDLPAPLLDSLSKRFDYLKSLLPDSLRIKTSQSKLNIGYLSQPYSVPKLFLENFGKDIYISPLLIRAALISGLSEIFEFYRNAEGFENPKVFSVQLIENYNNIVGKSYKRPKDRRSTLSLEMDVFYPHIQDQWRTQFDFVLLHEIGHIVDKNFTEEECDRFAINILKRNFSKVDLGVFSSMVLTYKNDYWGRSNDKVIREILLDRYDKAIKMIEESR
ncbi:ImmA/IrrE family metallo-endopeptidase [Chryseobacterium scophthalmum]|uniref:ImmA/IrrE family metallo-endopeptidase n=1 Tax=Chryseobacterium scophthalmum TaxID=59733 RepID=UPI003D07483D